MPAKKYSRAKKTKIHIVLRNNLLDALLTEQDSVDKLLKLEPAELVRQIAPGAHLLTSRDEREEAGLSEDRKQKIRLARWLLTWGRSGEGEQAAVPSSASSHVVASGAGVGAGAGALAVRSDRRRVRFAPETFPKGAELPAMSFASFCNGVEPSSLKVFLESFSRLNRDELRQIMIAKNHCDFIPKCSGFEYCFEEFGLAAVALLSSEQRKAFFDRYSRNDLQKFLNSNEDLAKSLLPMRTVASLKSNSALLDYRDFRKYFPEVNVPESAKARRCTVSFSHLARLVGLGLTNFHDCTFTDENAFGGITVPREVTVKRGTYRGRAIGCAENLIQGGGKPYSSVRSELISDLVAKGFVNFKHHVISTEANLWPFWGGSTQLEDVVLNGFDFISRSERFSVLESVSNVVLSSCQLDQAAYEAAVVKGVKYFHFCTFKGFAITPENMAGMNIVSSSFTNCNLETTDMSSFGRLVGSKFVGCKLSQASFKQAIANGFWVVESLPLTGIDLREIAVTSLVGFSPDCLRGAIVNRATIEAIAFQGVRDFSGAIVKDVVFKEMNFSEFNLRDVVFENCSFDRLSFSTAVQARATKFKGICFSKNTELSNISLTEVSLTDCRCERNVVVRNISLSASVFKDLVNGGCINFSGLNFVGNIKLIQIDLRRVTLDLTSFVALQDLGCVEFFVRGLKVANNSKLSRSFIDPAKRIFSAGHADLLRKFSQLFDKTVFNRRLVFLFAVTLIMEYLEKANAKSSGAEASYDALNDLLDLDKKTNLRNPSVEEITKVMQDWVNSSSPRLSWIKRKLTPSSSSSASNNRRELFAEFKQGVRKPIDRTATAGAAAGAGGAGAGAGMQGNEQPTSGGASSSFAAGAAAGAGGAGAGAATRFAMQRNERLAPPRV